MFWVLVEEILSRFVHLKGKRVIIVNKPYLSSKTNLGRSHLCMNTCLAIEQHHKALYGGH